MLHGYPTAEETRRIVEEILRNKDLYPSEITLYLFYRVQQKFNKQQMNLRRITIQQLNAWMDEHFPLEQMMVRQALYELSEQHKLYGNLSDGRLRLRKPK